MPQANPPPAGGPHPRIEASEVRYIKLGRGGTWAARSFEQGEVHLGFREVPDDLARTGDLEQLRRFLRKKGKAPGVASSQAREVHDFHHLPASTLWITFEQELLWWCFADPEVEYLGGAVGQSTRKRRTVDGWRNSDALGRKLRHSSLSSWLTKTSAYRGTICEVDARDYLMRRLNDEAEPAVRAAEEAQRELLTRLEALVLALHWRDFETLVDLSFARLGWRRISVLGETMADVDIVLQQPATGEAGVVQVKSSATQADLDRFWGAVAGADFARSWFVAHSGAAALAAPHPRLTVWTAADVTAAATRAGLADWILERSR